MITRRLTGDNDNILDFLVEPMRGNNSGKIDKHYDYAVGPVIPFPPKETTN